MITQQALSSGEEYSNKIRKIQSSSYAVLNMTEV